MSKFVTRFAPSPTGYLHLGHAYSALRTFGTAKTSAGTCLLRMEDIDQTRCKPKFEQAIYEDLDWLGLDWPEPVLKQSECLDDYAKVIETLFERGLIYRCFKTRKQIASAIESAPHQPGEGPKGKIYTGPKTPMSSDEEAERLEKGGTFAWRLSIKACQDYLGEVFKALIFIEEGRSPEGETGLIRVQPDLLGDVILARKDISTSYHISACHDDAKQGVTHIIRGQDLFFTTHLHVLLQKLMGWPKPIYRHHKLITDETGQRLAKRHDSLAIKTLRDEGMSADQLRKRIGC